MQTSIALLCKPINVAAAALNEAVSCFARTKAANWRGETWDQHLLNSEEESSHDDDYTHL